ncbi:unnamed protein product [Leuciscus chuanchicus]
MEFSEESVSIPFELKELEGAFTVPADLSAECTAVVLTHGAGGDMHARQLESLAHALARSGVLCLRFSCRAVNFMYRCRAYHTVVNYLKSHERFAPNRIFLGGRSMGARTAVAVCERMQRQKAAVQGVLCLSFPLHLPGKPLTYVERSRGLIALSETSVLFVSGTTDNLCEKRLLETIRPVMKTPSVVHWVKDANHGLKVRGRTEESVLEEVNPQIIAWVLQHK